MSRMTPAAAILFVLLCSLAGAQTTELVSVSQTGGEANSYSFGASISADGRFVSFSSFADNLVPGDTNGVLDVFVRDRLLGTTERLNVGPGGSQADASGVARVNGMSSDGRFVVFESNATNLLAVPTAGNHIYVRDRVAGITEQVDLDSNGQTVQGNNSNPSVSSDGRFVAFYSATPNVEVFVVRDRTLHLSVSSTANGGIGPVSPQVSQNGRYLGGVQHLNPGGTRDAISVTIRDLQTAQTWNPYPAALGYHMNSYQPSLSADGRVLTFETAIDWLPGDTNGVVDIFALDRGSSSVERVSVSWDGTQTNGDSDLAVVSPSGRFVTFSSLASNLTPGDTNNSEDIFLTDRLTHTTRLVSVAWNGAPANSYSVGSSVSDDGRFVAFRSAASNLVANDNSVLGLTDIFVRDMGLPATQNYCTAKLNSLGCLPSIGSTGTPSLSGADNFHVTATLVRNGSPGLLFWGTSPDSVPFAGGTRCVRAPILRTPVQFAGGSTPPMHDCSGHYDFHFSHAYMASYFLGAGSTVCAQYWARDAGHPDGTGQALTDGLQFTIAP